tara:strand:+ start:169 stop:513 length:345 start_codon:yes stop_codon:yes gene_type:complete
MKNSLIQYSDFVKIKICVGTIILIEESEKLKKPSFILTIDFGKEIGLKKSSAQLKANYSSKDLIKRQVLAVINFQPKQIGNIMSEVLVLGLPDNSDQPILVGPDLNITNGKQLY